MLVLSVLFRVAVISLPPHFFYVVFWSLYQCIDAILNAGKSSSFFYLAYHHHLPNQDKIRALGEKETYKYLGILEADTSKHAKMKKKKKRNCSRERENYSKPYYIAEISSKG